MKVCNQEAQVSVGREAVIERNNRHDVGQRSYGADFWPMTFVLIVILIATFVALGRLAELF